MLIPKDAEVIYCECFRYDGGMESLRTVPCHVPIYTTQLRRVTHHNPIIYAKDYALNRNTRPLGDKDEVIKTMYNDSPYRFFYHIREYTERGWNGLVVDCSSCCSVHVNALIGT